MQAKKTNPEKTKNPEIHMGMKMVQDVKPGGVFMINCQWTDAELDEHLNAADKKYIADNNIQLYTIKRYR